MFIPNEVLALNLGREGRAHARTLQFTPTGSVNVPNVGVVTCLLVPNDMGTLLARLLLQNDLPANNFGLNYVYRTFHNAADSGPGLGGQAGRPAVAGGCSPDRCYGAALINWQPHLAECATSIKVGVIDTGFDEKHPAFNGRRFPAPGIFAGQQWESVRLARHRCLLPPRGRPRQRHPWAHSQCPILRGGHLLRRRWQRRDRYLQHAAGARLDAKGGRRDRQHEPGRSEGRVPGQGGERDERPGNGLLRLPPATVAPRAPRVSQRPTKR